MATGCLFANATTAQNDYLEQIEAEARRLTDPDEADTSPPSAPAPSPETSISRLPEVDAGDAPAGAIVSRADPRAREFETHLSSLSPGAYSLYSLLNDTRKLEVVNLYVDSTRTGDDKLDSAIERILGYY